MYTTTEIMRDKSDSRVSLLHLQNIQEDAPTSFLPCPECLLPEPEKPEEPIEFLSRSWSISAIDQVAKSPPKAPSVQSSTDTSFVFAPSMASQMVMDRIMEHSLFSAPRRNSHSSGPLIYQNNGILPSPPPSPKRTEDHQSTVVNSCQLRGGRSVGRWFKDMKERKKEVTRAHNAQIHAAVSMAGVAAAVAAVAASTAATATATDEASKTSMAVASAASLVAAQCVEMAQNLGADHEHVSHVVSSAVNVKTAGDIMTLTAAAATALRGAATLKARTLKDAKNHAAVTPYEKNELASSEDGETEFYTLELLARGSEFLKRSKKGELHWRLVSVYANSNSQVVVKVRSRHLGLRKKRKGIVLEVDGNIPAWPGRELLGNGEQRHYFGLKTAAGVLEFECRNEYEHKLWTQGVSHLLNLSKQHALALTTTNEQNVNG